MKIGSGTGRSIDFLSVQSSFVYVEEAIRPNTIDIHGGQKDKFSCLVDVVNINIEEE